MKSKMSNAFAKTIVSGAAFLGLGAGVAQAQEAICVPISAQQIFAREYGQQSNYCSTLFNYRATQQCLSNAAFDYNNKIAQHPAPYAASYCDPLYVAQPPVYAQPLDPLAVILGTIIIGGAVYDYNHHDNYHRPQPPRHFVPAPVGPQPRWNDDRGRNDDRHDRHDHRDHRGPRR